MVDPIADFFHELARRGHEPMLGTITATVRFDIVDGRQTDAWRVAVRHGDLDVSHGGGAADCAVTAERGVVEGIVGGRVNAMAALLRGELAVSGDPDLLVSVQRLFPGPPRTRTPQLSGTEGAQRP